MLPTHLGPGTLSTNISNISNFCKKEEPNKMGPEDDSQSYEINKGEVNISNHYFGGQFRWTEPPGDEPKTTEEAQERIDKLYDSGVPFFSKEMIRFAFEQCQRKPPRGEMLYTKDITGAMVQFESQTGDVRKEKEEDGVEVEYIL
jgi:hypothetical protein